MNIKQVEKTNLLFGKFFDIQEISEKKENFFYEEQHLSVTRFIEQLIEEGQATGLHYLLHSFSREELEDLIQTNLPFLVFINKEGIDPLVIKKTKRTIYGYQGDTEKQIKLDPSLFASLEKDRNNNFIVITCIPEQEIESNMDRSKSSIKSFLKLISTEKKEISYIYLYAIIGGIISLSLPLGIQSIINFISSGEISTSVVILIIFIILGILLSGGTQIMQLYISEHIQQRLFAKVAFSIADKFPKVSLEALVKYYPPELINRFFDILTIQKGISNILIDLTSAVLQILFGLILLSLYHPYFIFFGILLVGILFLIIYFTGPNGLETSYKESTFKYSLAYWLEEIGRTIKTFKMAGHSNITMDKTDNYLGNYLQSRKKHFKVLVTQYFAFVGFKTLITAGLLIMGCILVVNKEINIGQFVASEIVIILIMNAVEKVILKLEKVYDLLTSTKKLEQVTALPLQKQSGFKLDLMPDKKGLAVQVKKLKYKYPEKKEYALKGVNLNIRASEKVCISGINGSGKTTFLNALLGLLESYEGSISFNEISLRDLNKNSFHTLIGCNLSEGDIFHGTILENITLGRMNISLAKVLSAVDFVGLRDFIDDLPEGLNTTVVGGNQDLPKLIVFKLILARSIVTEPKLLIVDDYMPGMRKNDKMELIRQLTSHDRDWTLLIISNDKNIMQLCEKVVVLKDGKNVFDGDIELAMSKSIWETVE